MAKPTIVLVHGAWADGSSGNGVSTELQGQGFTVLTPPNLLRGVATDAPYVASFLAQRTNGPVVLRIAELSSARSAAYRPLDETCIDSTDQAVRGSISCHLQDRLRTSAGAYSGRIGGTHPKRKRDDSGQ